MIGNALVVEDRSSGDSVMRRRATRLWRLPKTVMVLLGRARSVDVEEVVVVFCVDGFEIVANLDQKDDKYFPLR